MTATEWLEARKQAVAKELAEALRAHAAAKDAEKRATSALKTIEGAEAEVAHLAAEAGEWGAHEAARLGPEIAAERAAVEVEVRRTVEAAAQAAERVMHLHGRHNALANAQAPEAAPEPAEAQP